jgi:organic hydroperoxide reductase OsmC/OhrA
VRALPHHYSVTALAQTEGDVALQSAHLPTLLSAPPPEFDGPGDQWSPETLLVAALADCLILTFRAVARASGLPWTSLTCEMTGTLDRVDRVNQFTAFRAHVRLQIPAGTSSVAAHRLLERAERVCLVTNSLKARTDLLAEVTVGTDVAPSARVSPAPS